MTQRARPLAEKLSGAPVRQPALAAQVLGYLPQTQCGACGLAGCAPYAAAVAAGTAGACGGASACCTAGTAAPDACPPGGALLTQRLRRLLGQAADASLADVLVPLPAPMVASIREAECIGCTKCIDVCPTDAILGARQQLHGILVEDCTGCSLCLPPCPVDCIDLVAAEDAPHCAPTAITQALFEGPALRACTDCGRCAPACPRGLAPVPLARAVLGLDLPEATALGLARCTACRACDEACPERIPLAAHFAHGQAVAAAQAQAGVRAAHALERQAARTARLALGPAAQAITLVALPSDRADAAVAVQAALARARERRPP